MLIQLKKALWVAMLGFATFFGSIGQANAGLITGTWDPAYGAPFTDLGWRGTATFNISDPCLAQGPGTYTNVGACAGMFVQSAQVELYDLANPPVTVETLVYSSSFGPVDLTQITIGALGGLTDLVTNVSANVPALTSDLGIDSGNYGNYKFALQFISTKKTRLNAHVRTDGSFVDVYGCGELGCLSDAVVVTYVPEPGSLALVLGALVAVGAARRRSNLK